MRILIFFFIVLGSMCHAELRTWTAVNGKEVEAEFVSNEKGIVKLKLKSGKVFEVPLNKLSKADQGFLKAKSSPKEPTKEETPVNPNLKYEVKDSAVTITGCDKKASGELTIPATIEGNPVTSIGGRAFRGCRFLTKLTIPDSVTSIGEDAFLICTSLTSITIPDGVTSIRRYAFGHCDNLTRVTIPDSVTNLGDGAFGFCRSLTSITIPNGVASIGPNAFSDCESLTKIIFEENSKLTSIGVGAFKQCISLTTITIPDGVTSIGTAAFRDCTSLTSVTIPDSVTSIGGRGFQNCESLTKVIFLGDAPKTEFSFLNSSPTIYRKPEAKGWGDKWLDKPVKLISEKP
jgi:hypothetical protein